MLAITESVLVEGQVCTWTTTQPSPAIHPLSAHMSAEYIRGRLAAWAQQFAAAGLDGFFKPSAFLEACARSGAKLSAGKKSASKM